METNLFACRLLAACTTIPLLADIDTGYGNAVNVFHNVRAFEQAGLAGVMIEDQTWPKRCGHMSGKTVIDAAEMAEKVHAAVEARRDPAFIIKARTDAFATHGLAEAIRRLTLYAEAGAGLLLADALLSEDDIATAAREVPGPLCVNMGFGIRARPTTPLLSPQRLHELGVAAVIYPRLLTAAAVRGMEDGLDALAGQLAGSPPADRPDLAAGWDELQSLVGLEQISALERRYATP
jgi:2-methylisocitrate lyase-like PEP mutase family enzyme